MELTVAPAPQASEKPSEPEATSEPSEKPQPTSKSEAKKDSDPRVRNASDVLLVVILLTALCALGALLIFIYLARQKQFSLIWRRLTGRADDEDEDDGFEDDEEEDDGSAPPRRR